MRNCFQAAGAKQLDKRKEDQMQAWKRSERKQDEDYFGIGIAEEEGAVITDRNEI